MHEPLLSCGGDAGADALRCTGPLGARQHSLVVACAALPCRPLEKNPLNVHGSWRSFAGRSARPMSAAGDSFFPVSNLYKESLQQDLGAPPVPSPAAAPSHLSSPFGAYAATRQSEGTCGGALHAFTWNVYSCRGTSSTANGAALSVTSGTSGVRGQEACG